MYLSTIIIIYLSNKWQPMLFKISNKLETLQLTIMCIKCSPISCQMKERTEQSPQAKMNMSWTWFNKTYTLKWFKITHTICNITTAYTVMTIINGQSTEYRNIKRPSEKTNTNNYLTINYITIKKIINKTINYKQHDNNRFCYNYD